MSRTAHSHTPQPRRLSSPTPYQLRSLVLDYLAHHSYTTTAKAFLGDSAVKHFNADGDEVELPLSSSIDSALRNDIFEEKLRRSDWREEIRTCILSGRIDDATDLLNEHFPNVLSPRIRAPSGDDVVKATSRFKGDASGNCLGTVFHTTKKDYVAPHSLEPEHLSLNLRIQAFVEACRTIPLVYEPRGKRKSSRTSYSSRTPDEQEHPEASPMSATTIRDDEEKQMTLLSKAQKLYALVNMLPRPGDREQYHGELKNVAGLLAYASPEKSLMSKYLSQERREAVAEQINSAILNSSGYPVISTLELVVRHVTVAWADANEFGLTSQPGAVLPPVKNVATSTSKKPDKDSDVVPPFNLGAFLDNSLPPGDVAEGV